MTSTIYLLLLIPEWKTRTCFIPTLVSYHLTAAALRVNTKCSLTSEAAIGRKEGP